jgi:hypothetical protein
MSHSTRCSARPVAVFTNSGVSALQREQLKSIRERQFLQDYRVFRAPRNLGGLLRLMTILDNHECIELISAFPQFGQATTTKHISVHKDRLTLIAHQIGNQKAGE